MRAPKVLVLIFRGIFYAYTLLTSWYIIYVQRLLREVFVVDFAYTISREYIYIYIFKINTYVNLQRHLIE